MGILSILKPLNNNSHRGVRLFGFCCELRFSWKVFTNAYINIHFLDKNFNNSIIMIVQEQLFMMELFERISVNPLHC